jgi:hypothetical protein
MIDDLAQGAKPIPRGLFLQATIAAVIAGAALLSACGQSSDSQPPEAQHQADEQARKEADEKAWADAEKTGTVAAYTSYLQNFGSGAHVSEASQRIVAVNERARKDADEKAWADAEKTGTAAAYMAYIQNFGGGGHVAQARQRVTELSHKESDEKAWADAVRAGTAAAFTSYMQNFSSGAHVAEARERSPRSKSRPARRRTRRPGLMRSAPAPPRPSPTTFKSLAPARTSPRRANAPPRSTHKVARSSPESIFRKPARLPPAQWSA